MEQKMSIPKFFNYGNYSNDNYGKHCLAFKDSEGNVFYFSYETLVAFKTPIKPLVVHENVWGSTTGKHLNWIDGGDKKGRLSSDKFNAKYKEYFGNKEEL